ncbi:unnamed protein product [Dibothriocephalus latus]|uniref:Uncharacterized protein n=1 Tax=Dibothriocephalus latus TaxID=60516 RepID=A0A3P7L9E7_DIBLA|nr:unnamed protein product [Dibothriocephalus latus]
MAEWLGCVIHTLGWLVVVILSIFLNHGEASMGGGNLVTLTYTSVFVMDLVEVLYFTYLKPNMIIYYHRLYLVWVKKKTLENAAVEQLTSHILSCMYNLDTDSAAKSSVSVRE